MKVLPLLSLMLPSLALGQEPPDEDEVLNEIMNNVSHDYVVCAAYYGIVSNAVKASGESEAAAAYFEVVQNLISMAMMSASVGRSEEMAKKVTESRLETAVSQMAEEIEHNNANISILISQHNDRCLFVNNDPDGLMQEWQAKIFEKYGL